MGWIKFLAPDFSDLETRGAAMGFLTDFSSKAEIHRREVIKRFDDFFVSYFNKLETLDETIANDLIVTLLARAPASPVAQAVQRHADRFAGLGVDLRVIFAKIDPASDFASFAEVNGLYSGDKSLDASIRWAKNQALLDAHEQLVLGESHCWSGDIMRRSPDARFALDMFDFECASTVRLSVLAFDKLWSISDAIPNSRFRNVANRASDEPAVLEFDGIGEQLLEDTMAETFGTRH